MQKSSVIPSIKAAIKVTLKDRGIGYQRLARELGLSVATVKRTLNSEPLSMERILRICEILEVSFYDLMDCAKGIEEQATGWMTEAQERFLVRNPEATRLLIALMNTRSQGEASRQLGLAPHEESILLRRLEKQGLVTRSRNGTHRLAKQVLRGPRPQGELELELLRRFKTVVPGLVEASLSAEIAERAKGGARPPAKSARVGGFNLTRESRTRLLAELDELLARYSATEKFESAHLEKSAPTPFSLVFCLMEGSVYSEAWRRA